MGRRASSLRRRKKCKAQSHQRIGQPVLRCPCRPPTITVLQLGEDGYCANIRKWELVLDIRLGQTLGFVFAFEAPKFWQLRLFLLFAYVTSMKLSAAAWQPDPGPIKISMSI
jgi:hypothetical protein